VVLDDDVLTCPAERLRSAHAEMTIVGGRVVFERRAR
jgi:predicted amidohydrolase YtcJ